MTPEERFTRIENIIQAVVDTQARHEAQMEKQNGGIRDLIVVSRTIIDAQVRADNNMNQLTGTVEQLAGTVEQLAGDLKQLTSTVDRLTNTVDQLSRDGSTFVKSFQNQTASNKLSAQFGKNRGLALFSAQDRFEVDGNTESASECP